MLRGTPTEALVMRHKTSGREASPYGSAPWTGAQGDTEADWEMVQVGWTVRWNDGTIGLRVRPPMASQEEVETFLRTTGRLEA